ncbi:hypothetical protein BDD12DRAFT_806994 [Trichophaea hybrida]|nr:hypothetical protein BDD12DRAFT_806994 [Trichophaea hybrida]
MQAKLKKLEQEANEARRREEQFRKDLAEQQHEAKRRETEAIEAIDRLRRETEDQKRRADEEKAVYQRQRVQEAAEAERLKREAEEQQRQVDEQNQARIQEALHALSEGILMKDKGCIPKEARDRYIKSTQTNLQSNLRKAGLWKPGEGEPPSCYIVSRECVYDYIHSIEEDRWEKKNNDKIPQDKKGGHLAEDYIDEVRLIHNLIQTAYERRYISSNRTAAIVSSVTSAAFKTSSAASAASKTITSVASKTITSATSKFDEFLSKFPDG